MDSDKQPHSQPRQNTSTLFTPDPAEYSTQLELEIYNITLPMDINPKILGLTLAPKLTYNKHIEITTTKAHKTIQILKVLTSTTWGKQKETITATYKAITRPILEYVSTIWSPLASDTNINKLQITQNTALKNSNGVYNRHKHTTSTRRNTQPTNKGTPPTTHITHKTKITTTHTPTTVQHNKQHPDLRNLGFDPSVARLLDHDPTPRPTCPVYMVAECKAPVWARSKYAHLFDPELIQAYRSITEYLKPTDVVEDMYFLEEIAPPQIKRHTCARRNKQLNNEMHLLFGKTSCDTILCDVI